MQTGVIHYLDASEYYTIYGITTLMVVLALLWYFVRSNLTDEYKYTEGLNNPNGDATGDAADGDFGELGLSGVVTEYPPRVQLTPTGEPTKYHLQTGMYGDVPVVFYTEPDMLYAAEWRVPNRVYVKNNRSLFMEQIPEQRSYWDDHDQYIGVEVDGLTHLSKVVPQ